MRLVELSHTGKRMKNKLNNVGSIIDRDKNLDHIFIHDLREDRHRVFTYAQIDLLADRVAFTLQQLDISPGSRIGIISKNSAEYIGSYFGILRAGLTAVLLSHKFTNSQLKNLLSEAAVQILFLEDADRLDLGDCVSRTVLFDQLDSFLLDGKPKLPILDKNQPALILYSSGSNGLAKGVVRSHASQIAAIQRRASKQKNAGAQKHILASSLCHMHGINKAESVCEDHATLVLLSEFEPLRFAQAIQDFKVNVVTAVPAMLSMFLLHKADRNFDFSSVVSVNLGAAPITEKLVKDLKMTFPNATNHISSRYGMTEIGGSLFGKHPQGIATPELSVGYPLPEIELRLAKGGVLEVKCESLMTEYLNQPLLKKTTFTSDGYFITNDIFRIDDQGFYYCIGRADDMFICGGENIFPAEVEKAIELCPDVEVAVVVPVQDSIKGSKPVAFVIFNPNSRPNRAELEKFVTDRLRPNLRPRLIFKASSLPQIGPGKFHKTLLVKVAEDILCGEKQISDFNFLQTF